VRDDIKEIVFSEEEIRKRVIKLGDQITLDYKDKSPLLIGVLKGCFVFLADLARCIHLECEIRFITASSYGRSTVTSGDVRIGIDFDFEIAGRDVLIIEDILDSGVTLASLREYIAARSPSSVKVCAMLDKPMRRKVRINADYLGFECPDEFLVGYGLDYAERYRNLPFVASLKPDIYT